MYVVKCFGPPGTGKTTRLIRRVEEERLAGTEVKDMAYLSFSVAAKEVIKDRLSLMETDVRWFRTIHGAAAKSLGLSGNIFSGKHYAEFKHATGMTITSDEDAEFEVTDFNIALRAWNLSQNMCIPLIDVVRMLPAHPNLQMASLQRFIADYTKFKHDRGLFDFTDMLVRYERDGDPLPVHIGFVDEAQDNSELQWRCVKKMLANVDRLYLAGDDDQAIYTFIGASEYGFLDFPSDEDEILTKSYRVPRSIGQKADSIIKRIAHRKDKVVEWKAEPGAITRINRGAIDMDWRKLTSEFPAIMVLCRHRKGAQEFSKDLKLRGIAHSLHGETMNTWPEAKILHSVFALVEGQGITPKAAVALAKLLGKDTAAFRDMRRGDRVKEMEGVTIKTLDFIAEIAGTNYSRLRYRALLRLVRTQGYEALTAEPPISVSTMHAAKGREAPLVIINPECTSIVRQNAQTATEIRLAYVALTRAMSETYLMIPRTDSYIQHFF